MNSQLCFRTQDIAAVTSVVNDVILCPITYVIRWHVSIDDTSSDAALTDTPTMSQAELRRLGL